MTYLKTLFHLAVMSLMFISAGASAEVVDKTKPYAMMEQVSDNLFNRLKAEKDQIRETPNHLKVVVEEELMPYVNYRYAALKLLGSNLRSKKTKKEDVSQFIEAFHGYLVTSYAQVLTLYSDQVVEFGPEMPIDAKKRIIGIKVDVIDSSRPKIKIEFKLRKDKKSGEWLAYDMIAEGVSLLSSKQSEWNGKIRKEGIPFVTQELVRLSKQSIRFEGSK